MPELLIQSNNTEEAIAVMKAVEIASTNKPLLIRSNSKLVLDSLTCNLAKNEDGG